MGRRRGEGGDKKNPGWAPQLRGLNVGGLLWREVGGGVPLTWLPCASGGPRYIVPLGLSVLPQVKASGRLE